jgi:hypothetical protein
MVKTTDACGLEMDPPLTKASTYVRCHRVTVYVRLTVTHALMSISREGPSVSERLLSRKLLFRSFWERNSVGYTRECPYPFR